MAAHTPVRTLITADSATFRHTWRLASTGQLFGDSRSAYSNKAYDTVGLLSDVEVSVNLETAFIRPTDSYVYIKHIYNYGNGYDTYRVRGDSSLNFVVGVYVDMDADSQYDALDPPADILIVKDFTETVVLVVAQAGPTALDGSVDTLYLSTTSNDTTAPSAETVTLVLTVDSQPPTKPTPLEPPSGTETMSLRMTFTWVASTDTGAGLSYYRFELDTSGEYVNPILSETLYVTAFTPDSDLAANRYFWRVRAVDTVGNRTSALDSSLLIVDTIVTLSLTNPADTHETNAATMRFAWSTTDAETYTWQLSRDSAFTTIADSVVDTKATSMIRTVGPEDTYYWRVVARDTAGNYDTDVRAFLLDTSVRQVPAIQPADGHETTNIAVMLTWQAVADSVGIDSYALEVSSRATFETMVFTDTVDQAFTSDTLTGLYNDTYYWRVKAIDDLGNIGAYSDTRGFVTDTIVNPVVAVSPADAHETTNGSPVVTWQAVSDSVGVDSYVVEVSKLLTFVSTEFVDTVDRLLTTDTVTGLYNDTYYWRVKAIDELGNVGPYSDTWGFVTDTIVNQVVLVSPSDAHETTTAAPVVTWQAAADSVGVDTYVVEASKTLAFATTVFVDTLDQALTSDTVTGLYNDTYYWRVKAIDELGNVGPYSDTRGFVTDTIVNQVVLVSPADAHETTNGAPVVTWQAVSDSVGVDSYVVEASKLLTFATPEFVDTVDRLLTSDTVTGLYNDTYYWRVRAIDELANVGPYSDTRGFVTDTIVNRVVLVGPSDAHETTNATPVVTWQAVSDSVGVDTYVVEVSKSLLFTATEFVDTVDRARTSDTVMGLYNDTYYWRVRAIDELANVGPYSDPRGFVTDTIVNQVALMSPANAHETSNASPVVTWQAVSDSVGVDSYVVEGSKLLTFESTAFADTVDRLLTTATGTGVGRATGSGGCTTTRTTGA